MGDTTSCATIRTARTWSSPETGPGNGGLRNTTRLTTVVAVDMPGPGGGADLTSRDAAYSILEPLLVAFAALAPGDPGRETLREQVITGYLPVARNIARRYVNRGEPLDDLEQAACIGLLKAVDGFKPNMGHHFLSYAVPTITGEIRRHFRDRTWAMRVPRRLKDMQGDINAVVPELSAQLQRAPRPSEIAARLQVPTADVVEALQAGHAYRPDSLDNSTRDGSEESSRAAFMGHDDARFDLFTATHSVAPHLAALSERERRIIVMRFYEDMTQTQIAERVGVSQMQVSRILSATLSRLREAVQLDPA
jgi:RNA polymerase sigma-B factor